MLNADEALKLSTEKNSELKNNFLLEIENRINHAVNNGNFDTFIASTTDDYRKYHLFIQNKEYYIQYFENLGYKISFNASARSYFISWSQDNVK